MEENLVLLSLNINEICLVTGKKELSVNIIKIMQIVIVVVMKIFGQLFQISKVFGYKYTFTKHVSEC